MMSIWNLYDYDKSGVMEHEEAKEYFTELFEHEIKRDYPDTKVDLKTIIDDIDRD
jgi:hypothetical protein